MSVNVANLLNEDFQAFLEALETAEVRYILVGGYSVIIHGYSRTTGDMDIWVERSVENYRQLARAFLAFGMPLFDMSEQNFLYNTAYDVFTFGRPPISIDIITQLKGLTFSEAFDQAEMKLIDAVPVRVISYAHLLAAKKAAGRPRDINDINQLQAGRL